MEYKEINEQCSKGIVVFEKAKTIIDKGNNDSVYHSLANQLREYQKRFAEQKLTVLIAGEVKVGKSTFINTLLGTDVLPKATEVCTNVPSKIVFGEEEKILVHFSADDEEKTIKEPLVISREEVAEYSTETLNKENHKKVEYIEIQINSPILAEGLVFIDTPGLGAIDPLHAIATYRIATKADIIFFLGDVRKPLTDSEISSLKDLIKVSKSEKIVHLLTCCDLKDPEEILSSNKNMFEKDFKDHNITIIKISSLLYQRYVKYGNRSQLDASGFQQVRTYIAEINSELKTLLDQRFLNLTYAICQRGHALLSEVIRIVEDPEVKEKIVDELNGLIKRLQEIENNQYSWSQKLAAKQSLFNQKLYDFVEEERKAIIDDVSEKLQEDTYLEDKDALCKCISADMISFQSKLEKKIPDGFTKIYEEMRAETELKDIQEQSIITPGKVSTEIKIDEEIGDVLAGEKIRDIYVSTSIGLIVGGISYSVGTWAGAAAGAKVGALIGNAIAPAIGAGIGAALGAAIGVISGLAVFEGSKEARKKRQRNELLSEYTKQINEFFNKTQGKIKEANIPNSSDLSTRFFIEVRDEKKKLKLRHDNLKNETARIRANYNAIKQLVIESEEICNTLRNNEV